MTVLITGYFPFRVYNKCVSREVNDMYYAQEKLRIKEVQYNMSIHTADPSDTKKIFTIITLCKNTFQSNTSKWCMFKYRRVGLLTKKKPPRFPTFKTSAESLT